jgi:hypothetical protein
MIVCRARFINILPRRPLGGIVVPPGGPDMIKAAISS